MEVLNNLLRALLAGDLVLWSLAVLVAIVVWVVVDAAILARGAPKEMVDHLEYDDRLRCMDPAYSYEIDNIHHE